ncbi:hypothetical protein QYF36_014260 [Acer negundo]|nr:hypothetical protein QYF36_014260 [Acer negundo]
MISTLTKQSLKALKYPFQSSSHATSFRLEHQLFDECTQPNLAQHNHLLFDYSRRNLNQEALSVFLGILRSGLPVDRSTLSCVLKVCGCLFDHVVGRQVHSQCIKMQVEGVKPNPFTFSTVLGALADEGMAEEGVQVHSTVIKNGCEAITSVCNALISMYFKSKRIGDARSIFDNMEDRDSVTWNSMVAGYVANGLDMESFKVFHHMGLDGAKLTQSTYASVIKLCANTKELGFAKQIHCQVLKNGIGFDHNISTGLMGTYSKCNEMDNASKIFSMMHDKNVVPCTAMIAGYLQNGKMDQAVNLFTQMNKEGVRPNNFTYSIILTANSIVSPFQVHAQIIKTNYDRYSSVGTALLDAFVKLGNVNEAAKVFELIDEKDIVAWSAMLAGYAHVGDTEGAVRIFRWLAAEGVKPNEFTFSSVINASAASAAAVEQGKQFHAFSIKSRLNNALCVSSALVTMYARKGNIESANEVFKRQGERDLVSWNSMISGYAQHGHGKKAHEVFREMQRNNMEMDGITFIGVITACTHTGLVDEGQQYFDIMFMQLQIYLDLWKGCFDQQNHPQAKELHQFMENWARYVGVTAAKGNFHHTD